MDKDRITKARLVPTHSLFGLTNTGRRMMIKCPFIDKHEDSTASFVLYPDGSWHCYGCSSNGQNAIDMVIALGGTFREAVDELN